MDNDGKGNSDTEELENFRRGETLQRLVSLGELTAGIVHQARNRMTGALSFAQVGKRGGGDASATFSKIEAEIVQCMKLFEYLLNASRQIKGEDNPCPQRVEELVLAAENLTRGHLRMQGIQLEVSIADEIVPSTMVFAASDIVVQALLNLILNAQHVSPEGGVVSLSAAIVGDSVELSVSDQGPGVPPPIQEAIFEAFFTTKAPGDGTGLGLSTSRRQLRMGGSELILEKGAGPGATFVIQLPLQLPPTDKHAETDLGEKG